MDHVQLSLRGIVYRIYRGGDSASGTISVVGDEITFSGSSLCDGVGTYTWLIEGESLTFTAAEPADPCGGRLPVLDGVTYSRPSSLNGASDRGRWTLASSKPVSPLDSSGP